MLLFGRIGWVGRWTIAALLGAFVYGLAHKTAPTAAPYIGFIVFGVIGGLLAGAREKLTVCPHCQERHKPGARVCPHCQRDLPESSTRE